MKNFLPELKIGATASACEPPASALARWKPEIHASKDKEDNVINMYSTIGEYGDGQGTTPKLVSSILRNNKGKDITVNINSPGGSFFDGVAIYNSLRQHDGNVHINVVGLAASAASIIAMAGDTVSVAESGFIMIHNSWTMAVGNKKDMMSVADMLSKFDDSMAELYAKKTKKDEKTVRKMMDAETWLSGKESVELGFATYLLDSSSIDVDEDVKTSTNAALRTVDLALAKQGMPRSERRALIKELSGTPCAADNVTPCADEELTVTLDKLIKTLTTEV